MTARVVAAAILACATSPMLLACGGPAQPAAGAARGGAAGGSGGDGGAAGGGSSIGAEAVRAGGFFARDTSRDVDAPPLASSLSAWLVDKAKRPKLDGVPREWPQLVAASPIPGASGAGDRSMAMVVQYDDANLYVAASVNGAKAGAEDHAALVVAVPYAGGQLAAYELSFMTGVPGIRTGVVRFTGGAKKGEEVPGAKIVEAPSSDGYTFEAFVPWAALPETSTVRVGLRGVARFYTAGGAAVLATGTGDADHPRALPALPTEPEQSLIEGLLHPRGLDETAPKVDLYANVAGNAMKERVAVFGTFFTICGHGYRGGKEYFFKDLGGELVRLDARDLLGRGKDDLLVRRRVTVAGTPREWFEVWQVGENGEPATIFAHEIAVVKGNQRVSNLVHVSGKEIEIAVEPAVGWDAASYREATDGDVAPVLLPWGPVASETFRFDAGKFVKAASVPNNAPAAAAATTTTTHAQAEVARPTEPPTPRATRGGDLSPRLLDQFKKDHGVAPDVAPKADIQVNVAEDARPERVVVIDRDLVVLGPGFKGGTTYAFTTLSQLADAADVKDVTVRDLTGDGAAEVIVRGVRHVTPQPPGSGGLLDLEATFVYTVAPSGITRVFGIETAREQAGKRVQGLVQFVPAKSGKGFDVDVRPGRATGWTEKTYPWAQDQPGAGAVEPLLLPWAGTASLRYAWNGKEFALVGR